jgi:hypothetical protein
MFKIAEKHQLEAESAETRAESRAESGSNDEPREKIVVKTPEQERRAAARERDREMQRKMRDIPAHMYVLAGAIEIPIAILLLLSGIGYLKLRRTMGQTLGTIYAILAIAWAALQIAYMNKLLDQDFKLFNLIGFIYPVVTLFALRVIFKDDFVNP